MESLLLAAQQQQLRQLRKLQQMRRQAELAAELEAEGAKKLQLEEEKRAALEAGEARRQHTLERCAGARMLMHSHPADMLA
jgi:hypothetical protein